jgi:hypothetical protein
VEAFIAAHGDESGRAPASCDGMAGRGSTPPRRSIPYKLSAGGAEFCGHIFLLRFVKRTDALRARGRKRDFSASGSENPDTSSTLWRVPRLRALTEIVSRPIRRLPA